MLKKWISFFGPNPLDAILRDALKNGQYRFLIAWNRGLGDIPLGLYALVHRIKSRIPDAEINFLTREDLLEGFELLKDAKPLLCPSWKRGERQDLRVSLNEAGVNPEAYDVFIERPDPTRWLKWQLGKLTPRLKWDTSWDTLSKSFNLGDERSYIGVHVNTETGQHYGYEKNWPRKKWQELFDLLMHNYRRKILLFGSVPDNGYRHEDIFDLRGKTSLKELIAITKNHCSHLIAPDSGILSILYYVDAYYPLKLVSLWADPKQGVLRQRVASPNEGLKHIPLIGRRRQVSRIPIEKVLNALFS